MPLPRRRATDLTSDLPKWEAPQLTEFVDKTPAGEEWTHEIKLDGYRMSRIDRGQVQLLTGPMKYPTIATALQRLPREQACTDGGLCAVSETGVTLFGLIEGTRGRR